MTCVEKNVSRLIYHLKLVISRGVGCLLFSLKTRHVARMTGVADEETKIETDNGAGMYLEVLKLLEADGIKRRWW